MGCRAHRAGPPLLPIWCSSRRSPWTKHKAAHCRTEALNTPIPSLLDASIDCLLDATLVRLLLSGSSNPGACSPARWLLQSGSSPRSTIHHLQKGRK